MSAVSDLLEQSRAAHQAYRQAVPHREGTTTVAGDAVAAYNALWHAARLRTEAHALDPTLTDPAWREEPVTHNHDELQTFYAQMLTR